ncbi:MAG: hypothetical protein RR998_06870 [Oscillospiraceae bacterium]
MKHEALSTASVNEQLLNRIGPLQIHHGEGAFLIADDGERCFDAMSGAWVINTGYGRKGIAEVIGIRARKSSIFCKRVAQKCVWYEFKPQTTPKLLK